MTYTVYALRLRGDPEMRYIGRTGLPLWKRLYRHRNTNERSTTQFAQWFNQNGNLIEMVPLAAFDSWGDVKKAERDTIALCLAMGHRLFNRWLVPAELRRAA